MCVFESEIRDGDSAEREIFGLPLELNYVASLVIKRGVL